MTGTTQGCWPSCDGSATQPARWTNGSTSANTLVASCPRSGTTSRRCAFGAAISAPFATEKLTPFADWYRAAAAKGCQLRCVFEDTPMFRDLVRELQLRNLDDGLLGPQYEEGSIVAEAGTGHFDLIGPSRVEDHVQALVDRLTNGAAADRR